MDTKSIQILCVDFDGTLCTGDNWPDIGAPKYNVIDTVKRLQKHGWYIILYTCREGQSLREAVDWAAKHGIKFNRINSNAPWIVKKWGYDSRKPFAHLYLDDKAMNVKALDKKL